MVVFLLLSLISGLSGGLLTIRLSSSGGLLGTNITVGLLTRVSHTSVSAGHSEGWLFVVSVLGFGAAFGSLSGVDVVFIVLDEFDLHLTAISRGLVLEHEGRGSTSSFDLVGANVTLLHRVDGDVFGHIDVVGEINLSFFDRICSWVEGRRSKRSQYHCRKLSKCRRHRPFGSRSNLGSKWR